jgi:hypothetical protein
MNWIPINKTFVTDHQDEITELDKPFIDSQIERLNTLTTKIKEVDYFLNKANEKLKEKV